MKGEINYIGITTEFTRSSIEFYRDYKLNGAPSTQVLFGGFNFSIPTDENGLRFLEELLKIDRNFFDDNLPDPTPNETYKPFTIKVYDEKGYTTRDIELIDAHIKNYREVFAAFQDSQGNTNISMSIDIKVVSAIQRVNGKALNVFRWHISDYGVDEYQSPVNAVEETKKKESRLEFEIDKNKWRDGEFGFHKITPERKLQDKSQYQNLKNIHKVLKDKVKGKEYVPHWLSMRKGQTIKLDLKWSGSDKDYAKIAFDANPDFTFSLNNLKGQKQVEITCNNDAGTNTNGVQLLVKGDNKNIVGAINIFYPKPKTLDVRWVFVEIFGNDVDNLKKKGIDKDAILNALKHALKPALIDVNMHNIVPEIANIQDKKETFLNRAIIAKAGKDADTSVKHHAIYNPKGKTALARSRNMMTVISFAEAKDGTNKLAPNGIDVYFLNLGNLPKGSSVKEGESFDYAAGISPTGKGKAYLPLTKEGKIRKENIAHEVLHGIGLEHTFKKGLPIMYKQDATNNYMDYRERKGEKYHTEVWQWKDLHKSPFTK